MKILLKNIFHISVLLVMLVALGSCGMFKTVNKKDKVYDENLESIEGKRVYNPKTKRYEVVVEDEDMTDTLETFEIPDDIITMDDENEAENPDEAANLEIQDMPPGTIKKEAYNITLVLPFLSQQFDPLAGSLPSKSDWAIQFYAGTKIALQRLSDEGVQLNVNVLDSKARSSEIAFLMENNSALYNSDMIIGPYRRGNVSSLASYAKQNDILLISPFSASQNITSENKQYIQVNPSLERHAEYITRYVRATSPPENVILVGPSGGREISFFEKYQAINYDICKTTDTTAFTELIIDMDLHSDDAFNEDSLKLMLDPFKKTVFIVPVWSDETFVGNFLRMLDLAREEEEVEVYGLPQWMDYRKIDLEYFNRLKVKVSSPLYIDKGSAAVRQFRQNYFDNYGSLPDDAAYLGHDIILYFGRQLYRYGTKFQSNLSLLPEQMTALNIHINPVVQEKGPDEDLEAAPNVIDFYNNTALHLLMFEDFTFKKVN